MILSDWTVLGAFFLACFSSLFTIMNPISTVSVFIGMTDDKKKDEKINIAKRATVTAAIVMIIFGFMGNFILSFFSITLDAFRIAGGLLVAGVGLDMLRGNGKNRHPTSKFSYFPHDPVVDEPVTFSSESRDPDGFITKEEWFVNDVKVGQGHSFTYVFDKIGSFNVLLKVTDNRNSTDNIVKQVVVVGEDNNKLPVVEFGYSPSNASINRKITFSSRSYDPDGHITREEWFINGKLEKSFKGPDSIFEKKFKSPGIYNVVLRITDNKGSRAKMFKQIIISSDTVKPRKNISDNDDVSIIPLAIPMLSGPGSMTTALMLMSEAVTFAMTIIVVFTILLICGIAYWLLVEADHVDRIIGKTGKKIIDKLLGLIVLVVGVQFFINGLTNLVKIWTGFL